jgi:Flp pilus assembly protein TadG
MRRLAREERGTTLVLVALLLAVMLGTAAFVVDLGSWFWAQRRLQSAADAATLAGAQDLPVTATASSTATSYASDNVSGLDSWSPTFPTANTIEVSLSKAAPGIFSGLFGVASVTVHAHARAAVGAPGRMKNVAPIAVKNTAACTPADPSCFGVTKNLNFDESNLTASRFGLVSLSCQGSLPISCSSSSTGSSDLVNWIQNGYPDYLDVKKWYAAVTGEKIGPVRDALDQAGSKRQTLFFPVFDLAEPVGKSFHIIGWAAFLIDPGGVLSWKNDAPSCRPNCKVLRGHFTQYVAHGLDIDTSVPNFGVKVIALTE